MTATETLAATVADTSTTGGFVHLHVHTEFSKQDGLARLGDAIAHIKADGQNAIAMTDHGNTAGAWKFVQAAKKAGVKPVVGIETYMALVPDGTTESPALTWDDPKVRFAKHSRSEPDAESGKVKKNTNNHLTILVRNQEGWRNLCRITNAAEDSFWSKPLIDYALLKQHGQGLIILTGCLGGPVASRVALSNTSRRLADAMRKRMSAREDITEIESKRDTLTATAQVLRPAALEARNAGDDATPEQAEAYTAYLSAKDELAATNTLLADLAANESGDSEDAALALDAEADLELDAARDNLDHLIECVGRENVYVEIMEHGMSAEGRDHIKILTGLADGAGVAIVATNDSHYVDCDDHDAHDAWLASGTGKLVNDPDRWRFNGTGYHLRTEAEMRAQYSGKRWQSACDETVRIAERIEDDVIPYVALRLPKFPVPAAHIAKWEATGATVEDRRYKTASAFYLHYLVLKGAKERYDAFTPELKERLAFEEGVITGMGLEDYFLIVGDVLEWARSDRGYPTAEFPDGKPGEKKPILVGPGRGSAAGSAISYALWIVMVEPLANGLLFERFLDVARVGMPDIDVDFEAARRDEVYTYLAARYGEEYIARIGAFQVAKTKRAIKDAARVLNLAHVADKMTKLVPVHQGKPQSFAQLFEEEIDKETGRPKPNPEAQDFRDFVAADLSAAGVVALARKFEDVTAGESIHAAGVIISDEPLPSLIPMRRLRDKNGDYVGVPVALWDGKDIDDFGMLKLDALSLRNLDIVAAAVDHIADTTGETVAPDSLPDPDVVGNERVDNSFALLREGRTSGIFQLECVTGRTLVAGRKIADLYKQQENGKRLTYSKSVYLDDGTIRRNHVQGILSTGIKEAFRLRTASGRFIEATTGHRFMTERGWVMLGDLRIEDRVLIAHDVKTLVYRTCTDCGVQTNPDPNHGSERCYRCSATFHSNPSKSRDSISKGALRSYENGRVVWNLGLTIETSESQARAGRGISRALRGRTLVDKFGAVRAEEMRQAASERMRGQRNHMFGKPSPNGKRGYRSDLGHYVRSTWEADYARVLNYLGTPYEYEPETFLLVDDEGVKHTYTPDFYLPSEDRWVEIKGFMRHKDAMKIRLFQEQYPEHALEIVSATKFAEFEMAFRDLVDWECPVMPEGMGWDSIVEIASVGDHETYDIAMVGPAHNYLANGFMVHNSGGITELCEQIAPNSFADLSALVALYRPGPMGAGMHTIYADRKNGRVDVDYSIYTRDLSEQAVIRSVLDATYGVVAYQESLMSLAEVVAGFDADEKNRLRRAFSKKDRPAMEALKEIFIARGTSVMPLGDGTEKIAFAEKTLLELWRTFDASAEYLFNKSHSAAYGYLSYVTAYFKANWPTEYGAGILGVTDKADKRLPVLFALAREGIEVMGPDVNLSRAKTAPDPSNPKAVRLGLTEIRDVGANGKWIAHEREQHGDFTSMHDLMTRVKVPGKTGELTAKLSVTAVEGLIEAGAFDSLGLPRLGLMLAMRATTPDFAPPIPDAEWSVLEASTRQRVRLGVALGNHPMRAYRDTLREYVFGEREDRWGNIIGGYPAALHKVAELPKGNMITMGVLTSWAERTTRNGGKMANFTIEGTKASMPGTVFNDAIREMRKTGTTPQVGDIIGLAGQVKTRTVTNIEIDPESGEEIEESREVRELIGSFLEVVPVDTAPEFSLPEVSDDERVSLSKAITAARVRATEMEAEKKAAAAAARAAKKSTKTPAKKPVKKPLPDADDLEDFDDTEPDVPLQPAMFDLEPARVATAPTARGPGSRPWAGVMLCENDMGPMPHNTVLVDGVEADRKTKEWLLSTFRLAHWQKSRPMESRNGRNVVFRVAGGCWSCCASCERGADPCEHHGGNRACQCSKGCAAVAATADTYMIVLLTGLRDDPRRYLDSIVLNSPDWEPCGEDSPGWSRAPLSAFEPTTSKDTDAA